MSNATTTAASKINAATSQGWVILVLGGGGYILSETRIFGPMLSVILAAATIFQLNQYIQKRAESNG